MRWHLENCTRFNQSCYLWLLGSCTCAFNRQQSRWPWM